VRLETDTTVAGVRERSFVIERAPRRMSGLLWTPPGAEGPRPLVLIGHGASGSKRDDYVVALARRLVRHHGAAAAAIDGPVHGDRSPASLTAYGPAELRRLALLRFSQLWAGDPTMTDEMVADLRRTLDELEALPDLGPGPVGWWGLSMGTILGLPFVAAERRVQVAVLGLMGLTGPTRERIAADAGCVRCPVLFLAQSDDELFCRADALALFDAIGSADKRLHLHPGRHSALPAEALAASERFLVDALAPAGSPDGDGPP
jgi:dienelactone hydrolase